MRANSKRLLFQKIMLSNAKSVCGLYDKVQLAAARMLMPSHPSALFVCNVPVE